MASRFGAQYDKRGYFGAQVLQCWRRLTKPAENLSDRARLRKVDALEPVMAAKSRQELMAMVEAWRTAAENDELVLTDVIEEAFALVREASRRTTGLFHYPEQVLAGLTLVRGAIAEMATGEGKTLGVSLPAFVFALFGRGVHCVTVNSYLAERDCEFSTPIFEYLGMTVRHLPEGKDGSPEAKRHAYAADVTYGVGYEFGFDYMRDQLAILRAPRRGPRQCLRDALLGRQTAAPPVVQRELAFAIIDEVDSVLIDEAGSPLVISETPPGKSDRPETYWVARDIAESLEQDEHYELESAKRSVDFTPVGLEKIHQDPNVPYDQLLRSWQTYVGNALRAKHYFIRNVSYMIDEEAKVCIVDENTGRRFSERTWKDGLHQAVEAKEGVEIRAENDSSASITRQRYFSLYDTICGLTGTAAESAGEFWHFFKMPVEPTPLHKPCQRVTLPERIFRDHDSAHRAVVKEVQLRRAANQPILVGTRTIAVSQALAELLEQSGVPFTLLTAAQDAQENEIVAKAGKESHVLLATNMAGRGTHISLTEAALEAGGLHVIAVERNKSIRIDRQLIGRGARQGQPGSAQTFVSADDDIVKDDAPELHDKMKKAKADAKGEISSRFSVAMDEVQHLVERKNYESRLVMAAKDKWLDDIKANLA